MAIHPITKKCEQFITNFCEKNKITCIGGVAFSQGLNILLTDALYEHGYKEAWTCFTDEFDKRD